MMENFFGKLDADLRPPLDQIHFPTKEKLADYGKMIADQGGPTFAMAESAGAAISLSGRRIWALNSATISPPTSKPDPDVWNFIR